MLTKPSRRDEYDQLAVLVPLIVILFMFYRVREEENRMAGWWRGFWVYFFIIFVSVVAIIITFVTTFIDDMFESRPSFYSPAFITEESGLLETLLSTAGVLLPFVFALAAAAILCTWLYNYLFGNRGQIVRRRVEVGSAKSSSGSPSKSTTVEPEDEGPKDWAKSRHKVIGAHIAFRPQEKLEPRKDFGHIAKAPGKSFVNLSDSPTRRNKGTTTRRLNAASSSARRHGDGGKKRDKHGGGGGGGTRKRPTNLFTEKKPHGGKGDNNLKKRAKHTTKKALTQYNKDSARTTLGHSSGGRERRPRARSQGSSPRRNTLGYSQGTAYVQEPRYDPSAISDLRDRSFMEVSDGEGYGPPESPSMYVYRGTLNNSRKPSTARKASHKRPQSRNRTR